MSTKASSQRTDGDFAVNLAPGEAPPKGFVRGRTIVLVTAAIIVAFVLVNVVSALRNNTVNERKRNDAALIADPARVTRSWAPQDDGLVERLVTAEADQVPAVRRAVRELLLKRRNLGDYSVEGQKVVPGRADLEQSLELLVVEQRDVPGGSELVFSAEDPELVADLHLWGEFQQDLRS